MSAPAQSTRGRTIAGVLACLACLASCTGASGGSSGPRVTSVASAVGETESWAPLPDCEAPSSTRTIFPAVLLSESCRVTFDDDPKAGPSPTLVLSSADELAHRVTCIDNEQPPSVDFTKHVLVLARVWTEDGQAPIEFVDQGQTVTALYRRALFCPGGAARNSRELARIAVVPRRPELRARLVECTPPPPDCSGPPRP
jgi:hypothetical protein